MSRNSVPVEITEAAGDWLDRAHADAMSERDREDFIDWALRSPVHVEEFLRLSAIRAELTDTFTRQTDWALAVLDRVDTSVVRLHEEQSDTILRDTRPPQRGSRRPERGSRPPRRRWLSAAAGVAVLVIGGSFAWWQGTSTLDPSSIRTVRGEQRSVLLSDGSTVQLNTNSSVRIHLTTELREIRLLRGEALFDVAKDPSRPFRVISNGVVVEAIGTRFNVYRRDDETRVTVVEGRVAVERQGPPVALSSGPVPSPQQNRGVEVAAGMQVAVDPDDDHALIPVPVNLTKATAWTERRLIFEDETVAAIVAEFNRYNRERLIIGDPALRQRRLTGVFDANDPDEFIALLSSLEAIEVRRTGDGHRELGRAYSRTND